MTERLYYQDAYLAAFQATVLERADDGRRLYLDRTAFYPTSGGQPHDTGRLGGVEVVDVVDEGERIAHLLAAPVPAGPVRGEVDWARRFDHMQQHTGQHLLSAVLEDLYGFHTVSVHFGQDASTLDLDTPAITPEQVAAAETRANLVATENRAVSIGFEDAAAAAGLRKPSDRAGPLRIVTILELDRSACGGTHVRATGEIGAILIRKAERVRKAVRLEFLCGMRAVRRARADQELLARLAAQYSAAQDELPALVEAQRAELKDAVAGRREAEAQLDRYRAAELYAGAAPDAAGLRRIVVREERGIDRLRGLAQAVAALPRVVFVGVAASPPGLLVAASEDSGRDAGAMLRDALAPAGGRGGGTPRLAQGTVGAEALERVVEAVSQ
ncbi:MAG TPA: DHHA1 domain-containing protein [Gemmatimonadales bacterium]|nr:DHHA1 domain-containing protein [Gemmatimonadales bacterium]